MRITVKGRTVYLSGKMVGLLVVVCALGVQIPRIVFAFALSDNLEIKQQEEWQLLMTSAVMGAFVLTLGNAYLSHMLAQRFSRRNALWTMTAFAWGANLVFAVFIIAPSLRVGIDKSALASVLAEPFNLPFPLMRWLYCIVLALAFELLAAGSMAAYALASQEEPSPSLQALPISAPETPKVEPTQPVLDPASLTALDVPSLPAPDPAEVDEDTEASTSIALDSVDRVILNLYRSNPAMTKEEVARQVTLTVRPITRQTVGNRLKRLERLGLADVNGVVTVR